LSIRSVKHKPIYSELIVKKEYAGLVPRLSRIEYQSLKRSIKESGQLVPIIVDSKNFVLDGHNRLRICEELGIKPKVIIHKFEIEDKLQEQLFVINCNLERRQLNKFQKIELQLKIKPILQKIAKKNESLGGKGVRTKTPLHRVNLEVGRDIGVSHDTIHKVETILKKAPIDKLEKLRAGTETINHVYKSVQNEERRRDLVNQKPAISFPDSIYIANKDFLEFAKQIPESSVDLIFTDPPYDIKSIPIYSDLGKVAQRILKPGGSLVTYVGQYVLPLIMKLLESAGLDYWWILNVELTGESKAFHTRRVFVGWKPLLWYVKGGKINSPEYIYDSIRSKPTQKALHPWEQSTVEADIVIRMLTVENQIIFDPFMGSGTTGIAAIKQGRIFIGAEIDPDKFGIAKARINEFLLKEGRNKK
jgi:16S rRNA G966 N2-methylase RsmD